MNSDVDWPCCAWAWSGSTWAWPSPFSVYFAGHLQFGEKCFSCTNSKTNHIWHAGGFHPLLVLYIHIYIQYVYNLHCDLYPRWLQHYTKLSDFCCVHWLPYYGTPYMYPAMYVYTATAYMADQINNSNLAPDGGWAEQFLSVGHHTVNEMKNTWFFELIRFFMPRRNWKGPWHWKLESCYPGKFVFPSA